MVWYVQYTANYYLFREHGQNLSEKKIINFEKPEAFQNHKP